MVTPAATTDVTQPAVTPDLLAPTIPEITTDATPLDQPPVQRDATKPPVPELAPPPQIDEAPALRRRLAQFEAERQAEATARVLTGQAQQVRNDALARGLSEEDANWMAQRHYALASQVNQEQERLREQMQIAEGRRNAAAVFAKQYGVDADALIGANSPQEMQAMAIREKRYLDQELRLQKVEQGRVQPQNLNAAAGSRAGSVSVTPDNIDKLWMDYERAYPGGVNPYEVTYRKTLGM